MNALSSPGKVSGRLRCFVIGLVFASVASCATWLGAKLVSFEIPALLRNLPLLPGTGGQLFSDRLRERFPVGSPETDLIYELWREGFQLKGGFDAPERVAEYDTLGKRGFVACRISGSISWAVDDHDRLTSVTGRYWAVCL
ncbi:MAG TPA: hypothetical protein VEH76_04435 [Methylocystis sp.]|nr:hypothetical protein [Methylocystis sp.]